eukprot:CAMPEP_0184499178 /NCGR_PEP_ID=MMETSP0113_2-20130426/40846_1 /TAXON_ID=91329 /ORGANISM="Norrisiella sphaerica, Strain BC52" /LENGTH=350 /DNA_ID=CAMNT_0026886999 /DNA_START=526 /DNA_END=1574 /DNA_ORIENTATION=+
MKQMHPELEFRDKTEGGEEKGDIGCAWNRRAARSPEDNMFNRSRCIGDLPEVYKNWTCGEQIMKRTYGFKLVLTNTHTNNTGEEIGHRRGHVAFRYIEIPKAGSSFIKYPMQSLLDTCAAAVSLSSDLIVDRLWYGLVPENRLSGGVEREERGEKESGDDAIGFSFVRHPVRRFISGYGTIIHRLAHPDNVQRLRGFVWEWGGVKNLAGMKELDQIWRSPEPQRFRSFVDLYLRLGDGLLSYDFGSRCPLMAHVLSQTWFMNLYAGQIQYLGRLESMNEDYEYFFSKVVGFPRKCVRDHVKLVSAKSDAESTNRLEGIASSLNGSLDVHREAYYLKVCRDSVDKLNAHFS